MSNKLVKDLRDSLQREEERIHTLLSDVEVSSNADFIKLVTDEGEERQYEFDEVTERTLSQFLGVNPPYIAKCPSDLKAHNLNYWLDKNSDVRATLMVGPRGIETIHDPDKTILSVPEVAGAIGRVFAPDAEIVTLRSEPGLFHIDIMVENNITVPGNGVGDRPDADGLLRRPNDPEVNEDGTPYQPPQVFDITHGGVRVLAYPNQAKAPVVQRYMNRLVCSNGLTMPVVDRSITLRGNTVEDVIGDIEKAAEELLGSMDEALERYAELSDINVQGNPLAVIRHIGKEQGIPDRIVAKALDYAGAYSLGQADNVTSYDIMNIFTSLANAEGVRYSTANKLQAVGGVMVAEQERIVRRCERCSQLV